MPAGRRTMKMNGAGKRTLWITGSLVVAFLTLGCGEQDQKAGVETSATQAAAVQQITPGVVAATATSTPGAEIQQGAEGGATELPPDVTATVPDSLVTPGN